MCYCCQFKMGCRSYVSCLLIWMFLLVILMPLSICVDVVAQKENYVPDYNSYHNVRSLSNYIHRIVKKNPSFMSISQDYVSRNGQSQLFITLSNVSLNDSSYERKSKPIRVLLAYGEHAREFFPVESLIYFLDYLTQGVGCKGEKCVALEQQNEYLSWVLSNFELYIVALANPDGRKFVEKSKNFCWRGTAGGVDLNRNFDWRFGGAGSSSNPKDDEYRGPHAFSEPETKVFRELTANVSMDAFVSFHSGVRHIYIPFADSLSQRKRLTPDNADDMKELASLMAQAAPFRPFKYGLASQLSGYSADGTSFDYMAGVRKIPFSFAVELWQHKKHKGRSCFDEFNPHSDDLKKETALLLPLYQQLLSYLHKWKNNKVGRIHKQPLEHEPLLSRFKKDGSNLGYDNSQEVVNPSNPEEMDDEVTLMSQLKMLAALTIALCLLYALFRHLTSLIRKKRVVSVRSLSSTFSLIKNL